MGVIERSSLVGSPASQLLQTTTDRDDFFDAIGRPDLRTVITSKNPWVSKSVEVYLEGQGLPANGGLGILMSDMLLQAQKLELPVVGMSLIYPLRVKQRIDEHFYQREVYESVPITEENFRHVQNLVVKQKAPQVKLGLYQGTKLPFYGLSESNLGELYWGKSDDDHRMYQSSMLGFGSERALRALGLKPAVIQLNESSAAFSAIAQMDYLVSLGKPLDKAIEMVQERNILTNHTLVMAAVASFHRGQFDVCAFPYIRNEEVKEWIVGAIDCQGDDRCNSSVLATSLVRKANGVSKPHAAICSDNQFRRRDGSYVKFEAVTNGIFMDRWIDPRLMDLYRKAGVINEFDLPSEGFDSNIQNLPTGELARVKDLRRSETKQYLTTRFDQYGQPIYIPESATLACWTKRFAGYKRPGMIFADVNQLESILGQDDIHILLAGKAHHTDEPMKGEIQRILRIVDEREALRKRVHFVQNYDEGLAKYLVSGVDIWFNTPIKGNEACGTSWEKAIGNLAILISTEDGGVADIKEPKYLRIEGNDYLDEVRSLYSNLRYAAEIIDSGNGRWGNFVKDQLTAYLPILSGARMWKDYFNFAFPKPTIL